MSGVPQFRSVDTPDGPVREPVMVLTEAILDVGFTDDKGVLGYVDVFGLPTPKIRYQPPLPTRS